MHVCMYVHKCTCVLCVYESMYMCVDMDMCVHVCLWVCMWVCVGVWVRMRAARELYFCEGGNVPTPSWNMSTWTLWYKIK